MSDIYQDGTYLANNPSWHAQDSPWKATQITRMLDRNQLELNSICEVGCGAGEIIKLLADNRSDHIEYHGYDISPQAFDICSPKGRDGLTYHLGDLLEEDSVFDLVMAIDVFEHIEDYYGFLRRLRDRGQYKLFHIPLDLSVQTVFRMKPIMRIRAGAGHIHYFTKETAIAALKHTGYEIIDYNYTGSALELPFRGITGNLMKIPRRLMFSLNPDFAVRLLGGYSLMVLAK